MIDIALLKEMLKEHPRFQHSLGVANMAIKLNMLHDLKVSNVKIVTAALLHDITKEMDIEEQIELLKKHKPELVNDELLLSLPVMHAFSGSVVAKLKYEVEDEDIINAICYHTTGRNNMSDLEKLIFLSDYTETSRCGQQFEIIRELSYESIDKAIIKMYEFNFEYIKRKKKHIHSLSENAYKYYKGVTKC